VKREVFNRLVLTLEVRARAHPRLYALRVAGLAAFGYGYIITVLVAMAALLAGVVTMFLLEPNALTAKVAFVLGAVAVGVGWAILKGLWVRLPAPTGELLTPATAPRLFELIAELQSQLQAPPFHQVLLDGDFNASVAQVPRLGLLGWQRNYLVLGLPLLQALGPDEFKAVLAHEFGHLSARHSRFSGWIYRMRRTWERVVGELVQQQQRGAFLLTWFLDWYWPKFNAAAFVLSRVNEYVADAHAARLAGAGNAARALLRVSQSGAQLGEAFWPGVFEEAKRSPAPPPDVFDRLGCALRQGPAPDQAGRWLRAAFLIPTGTQDTHPSLTDRLQALGQLPAGLPTGATPSGLPPVPGPTAAEALLAPNLAGLTRTLSRAWHTALAEGWQARHREVQELTAELARETAKGLTDADPARLWHLATLALRLDGDAAALPFVNRLLELEPAHAQANFVRGRYELARDNAAGVPFLEQAMKSDRECVPVATELLEGFFQRSGRREDLRQLGSFLDGHDSLMAQAQAERADVTVRDPLAPHAFTDEQRRHLEEVAAAEPEVGEVFAARKVVRLLPENPCFVVAVRIRVPWWKPRSSQASSRLVQRLLEKLTLPGQSIVFTMEDRLRALGRRVEAVPGSRIYVRPR
jgi:Zn-dependent protease with chaperone function